MDFADKLAFYLIDRGLSQAELARRTGDHDPNINAILKRRRPPQPERITSWAKALGLSPVETAEFRALVEAAYLQRKLDKEGAGRIAHVAQLADGQYAINAVAGKGMDIALLLPGTHVQPPAPHVPTPIERAALEQRCAALSETHRRLLLAAEDLAAEIDALRAMIEGRQPSRGAAVGPAYKANRPRFIPDRAPEDAPLAQPT